MLEAKRPKRKHKKQSHSLDNLRPEQELSRGFFFTSKDDPVITYIGQDNKEIKGRSL